MEFDIPIVTILEFRYSVKLKISNIISSSFYSPLNKLSSSSTNKKIGFEFFSSVIIDYKSLSLSLKFIGISSVKFLSIASNIVFGVLNVIAFNSITVGLVNSFLSDLKNFFGSFLISFNIYEISNVFPPPGVPDIKRFYFLDCVSCLKI